MKKNDFVIAFSTKKEGEATKDLSLKIKTIFPKQIKHLIILFTPHYHPSSILQTIKLTLKPQTIVGIQAPFLIFERTILQKGIVACCINEESVEIDSTYSRTKEPHEIEEILNTSLKKSEGKNNFVFSFVSPQIKFSSYLKSLRLSSLVNLPNIVTAGYTKRYSNHDSQLLNGDSMESLVNISITGLRISSLRLSGYLPLGKPFKITKMAPRENIILEIDKQPAINIYKRYLEEKFPIFKKNNLFPFYPLGIKQNGSMQILSVIDCLNDGSLLCLGEAYEGTNGHIMFLDHKLMLENIQTDMVPIKTSEMGLAFVLNSMTRKKILRDTSAKEVDLIKTTLGENIKVIGIYSDYTFFPNYESSTVNIESGNVIITLWQ